MYALICLHIVCKNHCKDRCADYGREFNTLWFCLLYWWSSCEVLCKINGPQFVLHLLPKKKGGILKLKSCIKNLRPHPRSGTAGGNPQVCRAVCGGGVCVVELSTKVLFVTVSGWWSCVLLYLRLSPHCALALHTSSSCNISVSLVFIPREMKK